MRRVSPAALVAAKALLSSPAGFHGLHEDAEQQLRADSAALLSHHGLLASGSVPPAELDRRSRQRRRARQTHPGKRGGR